ncbi:MAG: histidine kinase [Verrucomicrobiota bacterium]
MHFSIFNRYSSVGLFMGLLVACGGFAAQQEERDRSPALGIEVFSIEVDNAKLSPGVWSIQMRDRARPLTLPAGHSLRFHFRDRSLDNGSSPKLKYLLAGYDSDWHQLRAHAQLSVRFLDADGAIIGTEDLNANGESAGWRGNIADSEFSPRLAKLRAPERSKRMQLVIISSIPEMLGQYAVCDIGVSISSGAGTMKSKTSISTEQGVEMDSALGSPLLWARSGTRAQLAQVVTLRDGKHALALNDNESKTFGAWLLKPQYCPEVSAGDEMNLSWSECFSLGRGGDGIASYENLPPGNYNLLVTGQTIEGREFAGNAVLEFEIPPPFWERPLFWMMVGIAATICAFVITRVAAKRKMRVHLAELERQNLVEKERARIARDIHDELGASLAAIALMSSRARQQVGAHPEAESQLDEISKRAMQTARQLAEIVWAVNPARDSVEHLVDFVAQFAQEYLALANIRFRTEIPEQLPELSLSATARHEVFLAAKELVHNAVRHGKPTVVFLRVECDSEWLVIEIEDNGCGFHINQTSDSRGLSNVTERMTHIGGEFVASSIPSEGSRMQLRIPLGAPNRFT